MHLFWRDLRYAVRILVQKPLFTTIAALTLALGIGANTAVFSIINTVVLRPLPFRDPANLIYLEESLPKLTPFPFPFSPPDLVDFQRQQNSFDDVAAYQKNWFNLSGSAQPERIMGARISASLLPLIGVRPLIGRNFAHQEDQPGSQVVLLSYGLWQRRFGSDLEIQGKTVLLDEVPYSVVGVLPRQCRFPLSGLPMNGTPAEVYVPLALTNDELGQKGSHFNFSAIGRLKPGVSLAQARAEAQAIARRIQESYSADLQKALPGVELQILANPLHEMAVGNVRTPLLLMLAAVGLVLLIGCANVANLLLAKAAGRQREIALRMALGASRTQLARQMITESLALALFGGALGLLAAFWIVDAFVPYLPAGLPLAQEIGMDTGVLLFSLLASVLTAIVFGLAPAAAALRTDIQGTLKEGCSRAGQSRARRGMQSAFVVAEFVLAFVLLAGAELLPSSGDPSVLVPAVRNSVIALDPQLPVTGLQTMDRLVSETVAPRRFSTLTVGIFAVIALLLASIGVYGVLAYAVTEQTHEIGLRMALGADSRMVMRTVIARGLRLALIGLGIGVATALALTRLMASLLYGVSATDPLTFITVSLLLAAVATLASYVPARRAIRIDPLRALRWE